MKAKLVKKKPGSIGNPISQHQTTFGIRVVDFNRLFRKVVLRDELNNFIRLI